MVCPLGCNWELSASWGRPAKQSWLWLCDMLSASTLFIPGMWVQYILVYLNTVQIHVSEAPSSHVNYTCEVDSTIVYHDYISI